MEPGAESRSAGSLLRAAVRARGVRVGDPIDLLLGGDPARAVGFEVRCQDGTRRFLPWAACRLDGDDIDLELALALLEPVALDFYRAHGTALSALRGRQVVRGHERLGRLADITLDPAGLVTRILLDDATGAWGAVAGPATVDRNTIRLLDGRPAEAEPLPEPPRAERPDAAPERLGRTCGRARGRRRAETS